MTLTEAYTVVELEITRCVDFRTTSVDVTSLTCDVTAMRDVVEALTLMIAVATGEAK